MKTLLLAVTVLTLSLTVGKADSTMPARFALDSSSAVTLPIPNRNALQTVPRLSIAPLPGTVSSSLPTSASQFAQLGAPRHSLPFSPTTLLTLIAVFVLAARVMVLNHARALADHERDSFHGKAQMFRSLHEERSGCR